MPRKSPAGAPPPPVKRLHTRAEFPPPPSGGACFPLLFPQYPAAQTRVTLVSNTGQATDTNEVSNLIFDWASGFTTGGNAAVLTRVDIPFLAARPAQVAFSVSIRSSSGGNPGASLGTLTNTGSLSVGTNSFASDDDGIALAANTTYFLVIDVTDSGGSTDLSLTNSDAEDSGAAAGWSVADAHRFRSWASTGSWNTDPNYPLQFSVHGYEKVPEEPERSPEAQTQAQGRSPQAQAQALKKTLAGVASQTLTSALGHIGARFGDTVPSGNLTLAGQPVNLAAQGAGAHVTHGACPSDAVDRYGLGDAFRRGISGSGGGCEGRSRGAGADELLHASAFSLALGAAEGSEGADPAMPRWSVWGLGDYATFEGRPKGIHYDGEARSGWLGVDAREGPWVAGLALSHGVSEADYGYDGGGDVPSGMGRLETTLTALYPYGRWTLDDGLELRGVLGAGTGEARHVPGGGTRETGDLSMRMVSAGVRQELPPVEGIGLAARADAGVVHMEVDDGPETIAGVSADSRRVRLGLEASRRFALEDAAALTPFVEAVGRRDGGDGLVGSGLEVAGGVRYSAPGVEVEARGRILVAHAEEGARERGVSVAARVRPGANGRGLSLSLSPRWGAAAGGARAIWRDEMPRPSATGAGSGAAMDARIGYGVALVPEGLLTPFAETGLVGDENRRFRLGTRFDASHMDLGVELSGERRESVNANPEHALRLDLTLRF